MCGICAYVGLSLGEGKQSLASGLDQLSHRGPDGSGTYSRDGVHLGQTRLQILGDAVAGAQPIRNDRYGLVFNGEIHNYRELAAELGRPGLPLSDSEVLFELLCREGMASLPRLRGFWAFVFVDFRQQTLYACRDRFGQKPLLYAQNQHGVLSLASEAVALNSDLVPDRQALAHVAIKAQYPPAPGTLYEGVNQVRPGHYLSFDLQAGTPPGECRYYTLPNVKDWHSVNSDGAAEELKALLTASVGLRLRADTAVGLLLSAGKDSGTLAAELPESHRTAFTYDNRGADSEYPEVSDWYGSRFEIEVAFTRDAPGTLQHRVNALHERLDAPLLSASLLALDMLYASARASKVPVLLSGQGADEIFGGYNHYLALQSNRMTGALARINSLGGPVQLFEAVRDRLNCHRLMRPLLHDGYGGGGASSYPQDLVERMRGDVTGAQLQTMLWYEDRIAMMHGVETRYPYLDVEIVKLCFGLPACEHVRGFSRKRLLHKAFAKTWPPRLRSTKIKRGLPAAESQILDREPLWVNSGLEMTTEFFESDVLGSSGSGPRSARAVFRLAAIGHWIKAVANRQARRSAGLKPKPV